MIKSEFQGFVNNFGCEASLLSMFLIEVLFSSRVEEDDNEIDIEREFERLLEILKVCLF